MSNFINYMAVRIYLRKLEYGQTAIDEGQTNERIDRRIDKSNS